MATYLYRLGHFAVRRRKWVLSFWVVLLVGVGVFSSMAGGETVDSLELPGTESQQAFDLLEAKFPAQSGSSTRVVFAAEDGANLSDSANVAVMNDTMARIGAIDGVGSAVSPTETGTVSPDGLVAFGDVRYPVQGMEVSETTLEDIEAAVAPAEDAGVTVKFGGEVIPGAVTEPPSSEAIGLAVAVIVLLVSFGSVLAMGLPLFTALIGLGVGLTGITLLSAVVDLSSTAPILATMIGLAVGIDYALFIVTRHRQNLAEGLNVEEAAAPRQRHRRFGRGLCRRHRRDRTVRTGRDGPALPDRDGPRRSCNRRDCSHRRRHPAAGDAGLCRHQHRPLASSGTEEPHRRRRRGRDPRFTLGTSGDQAPGSLLCSVAWPSWAPWPSRCRPCAWA
jgi:hypothetical protein